jgi:hypothetical protein
MLRGAKVTEDVFLQEHVYQIDHAYGQQGSSNKKKRSAGMDEPASPAKGFDCAAIGKVVADTLDKVMLPILRNFDGLRKIVWLGHGGLDAFLGLIVNYGALERIDILIFTCNAAAFELPSGVEQVDQEYSGLTILILDTLTSSGEMADIVQAGVGACVPGEILFLHGESGMDILCDASFVDDEYQANLDFFEDYFIPKLVHSLYPKHEQHMILTNPGLDLNKGADRERLGKAKLEFETFAGTRFIWTDNGLEQSDQGHELHEAVDEKNEDWKSTFAHMKLKGFQEVLRQLGCGKEDGTRLSVAMKHELLCQQGKCRMKPLYQHYL